MKYVSRLNKEGFARHEDWRIPTLGELCSLLEPTVNEKGYHIDPIFRARKSMYWTTDSFFGVTLAGDSQFVVDFAEGKIDMATKYFTHVAAQNIHPDPCFVRAVRTIK